MIQTLKIDFDYDKVADVLYASFGESKPAKTIELDSGLLLRIDPFSNDLVGFTIVGYMQRVKDGKLVISKEIKDIDLPVFAE